jgi:pimeloyl-ACP methyl ester carboxylesterase
MANELIKSRDDFCHRNPEQHINISDRSWGAIQVGASGPALVLLPGTLGRGDIFWNQINALNNRARILALSYPKDGSIEEWSEDICALMDAHEMQKATILGSSLGGYTAQYFVENFPDRVDKLIAANTLNTVNILSGLPPYNSNIEATPMADLRKGFAAGLMPWADEEPDRAELVELLMMEVSGRILGPELKMRLNALKNGPELPPVTMEKKRIFTVESLDDRLIPAPVRDAVRKRLDPMRSYKFVRGSHFPYVTHPVEYTTLIAGVLGLEKASTADEVIYG